MGAGSKEFGISTGNCGQTSRKYENLEREIENCQVDVNERGGGADLNAHWTLNGATWNTLTAPLERHVRSHTLK